jgi:hypothetical protein
MKDLHRRIDALESRAVLVEQVPRIIVLTSPDKPLDRLTHGDGRTWARDEGEDEADFLARVERDLGRGHPVLLAAG